MATALRHLDKQDEAIGAYNKSIKFAPKNSSAYNNLGITLEDKCKTDDAIEAFRQALSLKPNFAEAHRNLSSLIKYKPEDSQIDTVYELLVRPDINDEDRCQLSYAYAKMKEDIGELDQAFKYYVHGGMIQKKLLSYDLKQDKKIFDQVRIHAPQINEISINQSRKVMAHTPIFIIGMPRSGTTLVEQIISNHSRVHGAGELPHLNYLVEKLINGEKEINSDTILSLRSAYLTKIGKLSEHKQFITDKMTNNFLYIPLIIKSFPEAKIIHVKRNPAATCWSNFKHYFSKKGISYSYDLNDIVGYYKMYDDLMKIWDQHFGSKIYHLDYDRLTLEQEIETRKLIEHLVLDWEDACLSPHENNRIVRTASKHQVKAKVYKGSSQAWRRYETFIGSVFHDLPER